MLEEYKEKVKEMLDELVEQAGLLGLANILKSATINMELSDTHKSSVETLYNEIMEEERITELDQ